MDTRTRLLRFVRSAHKKLAGSARKAGQPDLTADARRSIVNRLTRCGFDDAFARHLGFTHAPRLCDDVVSHELARHMQAAINESRQTAPHIASAFVASDIVAQAHEQLATIKGIGVHYTPTPVAAYMAESAIAAFIAARGRIGKADAIGIVAECGGHVEHAVAADIRDALEGVTICDPACGAGHLLIAVAETLARVTQSIATIAGASPNDITALRRQIATRQIRGCDIDADAIAIARMRLALWAANGDASAARDCMPPHVQTRDALSSRDDAAHDGDRCDIVIMNPPYVPTYSRQSRSDLRPAISAFASARSLSGRLNLFSCFILRALELVGADGTLSLIVPDTFASATAYAEVRRTCAERFATQSWARIDARVFKAQVGSVILTCSSGAPSFAADAVEFEADSSHVPPRPTTSGLIAARAADDRILFFENRDEQFIWSQMRIAGSASLSDFATIRDGVNTGPRRMRDILLDPTTPSICRRPLIEGGDIDPRGFLLRDASRTILYDPSIVDGAARTAGASLRDPAIFESAKVVTRQTADTIIAAVESVGGVVALNSVHCIGLPAGMQERLPGLAAFLNAPLVRLFYALDGGEQRAVLPQVRIAWLRGLPVPSKLESLLDRLTPLGATAIAGMRAGINVDALVEEIHDCVCEGYRLNPSLRRRVRECYLGRFPRFADSSRSLRRRSARVA